MQNYILVGAGGTGTHLLNALYTYLKAYHNATEWMLFIIDGDIVEMKNLERQLFVPGAVTMNKATAAAEMIHDPEHVVAYPEYLSEQNLDRFIKDGDTVFIGVDNFTVRKRIEDHVRTLPNAVIINGGNEATDGSIQLWVRENGQDVTPRIGYLHPEIAVGAGADRAEMTCQQAAQLPGGQQLLVVNMLSASYMLTALWRYHNGHHKLKAKATPSEKSWTELQFDALNGKVEHIDQRLSAHWKTA